MENIFIILFTVWAKVSRLILRMSQREILKLLQIVSEPKLIAIDSQ